MGQGQLGRAGWGGLVSRGRSKQDGDCRLSKSSTRCSVMRPWAAAPEATAWRPPGGPRQDPVCCRLPPGTPAASTEQAPPRRVPWSTEGVMLALLITGPLPAATAVFWGCGQPKMTSHKLGERLGARRGAA